jgi:pimeloyl-ACP methyl ester carboxylesterase
MATRSSALSFIGILLTTPLLADNILTVTGSCADGGASLNGEFVAGTSWQQTGSFSNVSISIPTSTKITGDGTVVNAFLTTNFSITATTANEVARATFVIPTGSPDGTLVSVFKGLTLGPGTYDLNVIGTGFGEPGGWCSAQPPTVSAAAGVTKGRDYILNNSASYPPAGSLAEFLSSSVGRQISITGTPGAGQTGTITIKSNLANVTFTLTPQIAGAPSGGPYPVTITNAPVGQYSIRFADEPGYTTPTIAPQALNSGGSITFDGEYMASIKQTVFLIHGIGQSASDMSGLASSLQDPMFGIDASRFQVDAGFDFGYCAATPSCSEDCTIQSGARALALYINQQSPTGNIVLIGYSMGGLIARDMIVNNYLNVVTNNHVVALITLGTPNLGYPYDPADAVKVCNNLAGQMYGDFRNDASVAPALPAVAGAATDFTDHNGSTVSLSGYLYNLNTAWISGGFLGPDVWFAVAGGYANSPIRSLPIDGEGCPDRNVYSDTVVCADSAAPALGLGPGLPSPWFGPLYTHTGGLVEELSDLLILGSALDVHGSYPLFNPPKQGDLIAEIRNLINRLPPVVAGASVKPAARH